MIIVSAPGISISDEFPIIIALVAILSRLRLSDWGMIDNLRSSPAQIDVNGTKIEFDPFTRPLYHNVSLTGRGTFVVTGNVRGTTEPLSIKFSYPVKSWRREQDTIARLREGLSGSYAHFFPVVKHATDLGYTTNTVLFELFRNPDEDPASRVYRINVHEMTQPISSLTDITDIWKAWADCARGK
jgi:hypothetical protein